MTRLIVALALLLVANVGIAQKSLFIYPADERPQLVRRNSNTHYYYGPKMDKDMKVENARTRLVDYPHYIPGYIEILSQKMTQYTYYDTGAEVSDFFEVEVKVKIRPDRDIENAYLIVEWDKTDSDKLKIACPIGKLKAEKKRTLKYTLPVNNSYKDSQYRIYMMMGGVQIFSAKTEAMLPTPFERYKKELDHPLTDGEATPMTRTIPNHFNLYQVRKRIERVTQAAAEASEEKPDLSVRVLADIDENGYVTRVRVKDDEIVDELIAAFALETVQLWTFKPKIEKGKPVESQVTIPFSL